MMLTDLIMPTAIFVVFLAFSYGLSLTVGTMKKEMEKKSLGFTFSMYDTAMTAAIVLIAYLLILFLR